ncbi:MMPL family transporter [Amycolatopsis sp. DG1A-15b]|uniref:MMPL family transporter n=1 Tax=Amycolatopsis sp. DG1A-15b TaxID=3052846 RepID=UPI00255B9A02|nr:MMPL family transporter [Amycolatopsis sp. DG1A-15b]WIX90625.1 MMPL family transporter [Amycolatopsis sp. DG1A-15b]
MKPSLAVRTSCWCAEHPIAVIALWLVFVAVAELPGVAGGARLGDGSLSDPDVAANWWPVVAAPIAIVLSVPFSRLLLLVSALFISIVTATSAAVLDAVSESAEMSPLAGNAALLVVITVAVQHMLFAVCRSREAVASGNDASRAARIVASTAGNAALVSGGALAVSLTAVALVAAPGSAPVATAVLVVVPVATLASLSLLPALNDRVLAAARPLPPLPSALKVGHLPRFVRPTAIAAGVLTLGAAAVYGSIRMFSPACAGCRPLAADLDGCAVTSMLVILGLATLVVYRRPVVAVATFLLNGVAVLAGLGLLAVLVDPLPGWAPMVLVVALLVPANHLQVYLLHRLRSETLAGMSRRNTVAHACRRAWSASGGALLVTVVMWLVWGLTERGDVREFALATTLVLVVDTTIVRFLLLPRLAVLGGRTSWWRPVK